MPLKGQKFVLIVILTKTYTELYVPSFSRRDVKLLITETPRCRAFYINVLTLKSHIAFKGE